MVSIAFSEAYTNIGHFDPVQDASSTLSRDTFCLNVQQIAVGSPISLDVPRSSRETKSWRSIRSSTTGHSVWTRLQCRSSLVLLERIHMLPRWSVQHHGVNNVAMDSSTPDDTLLDLIGKRSVHRQLHALDKSIACLSRPICL